MSFTVKRIYESKASTDGVRVLVDRLWPRGLSKEKAAVDHWLREAAPSTALRKWYGHDPEKWSEFRKRYFAELDAHPEELEPLIKLGRHRITLLFGSTEERLNNAHALKEYMETRPKGSVRKK
jgi:uncharacterized protein YeaO (DUF488 family)